MTIDEAIAHAREVAKEQKSKYDKCPTRTRYNCAMCFHNPKCDEDAKEHEQLAEWLEELKELRNMTAGHLYAVAFNRGYLKAEKEERNMVIDDFVNQFNVIVDEKCGTDTNNYFRKIVKEIAEQLKAGGENE